MLLIGQISNWLFSDWLVFNLWVSYCSVSWFLTGQFSVASFWLVCVLTGWLLIVWFLSPGSHGWAVGTGNSPSPEPVPDLWLWQDALPMGHPHAWSHLVQGDACKYSVLLYHFLSYLTLSCHTFPFQSLPKLPFHILNFILPSLVLVPLLCFPYLSVPYLLLLFFPFLSLPLRYLSSLSIQYLSLPSLPSLLSFSLTLV